MADLTARFSSLLVAALLSFTSAARTEQLLPFTIVGDVVAAPLGGHVGNAVRGERLVRDRERGNCLICHSVPVPEERFQGNLGPPLSGVGTRLTQGQIRLRLIDQTRVSPDTIMPSYYRTHDLVRVAPRYQGKPALTAAEIEDVVVWLAGLKE
jgi:L-cysteine S-thiosulfotransferase